MDEQGATGEVPQVVETTTEVAPETTQESAPSAQEAVTRPSWHDELDKADPSEIVKHNRVAGIIGDKVQKALATERQRIADETAVGARQKLEAELEELARSDPEAFSDRYLRDQGQRRALAQLNQLEANVRNELGKAIGRRLKDESAWQELSDQGKRQFLEKLNGLPESEVIPVFNDMVSDLRAEYRSNKRLADWKARELVKEREAIRQEEAARLLKSSEAPDTTSPKGQAKTDINGMSNEDFDRYWDSLKGI